jgi:hypothetical protein
MTEQSGTSIAPPARTAVVLAVSPLPAVRVRRREILFPKRELDEGSGCGAALALPRGQSVPDLLCKRDLADGSWEDVASATAKLPAPPKVMVLSPLADESLWVEVLHMDDLDVLITHFEPDEVFQITFAPWSCWEYAFCAVLPKEQMRRTARLNAVAHVLRPPCRTTGASA